MKPYISHHTPNICNISNNIRTKIYNKNQISFQTVNNSINRHLKKIPTQNLYKNNRLIYNYSTKKNQVINSNSNFSKTYFNDANHFYSKSNNNLNSIAEIKNKPDVYLFKNKKYTNKIISDDFNENYYKTESNKREARSTKNSIKKINFYVSEKEIMLLRQENFKLKKILIGYENKVKFLENKIKELLKAKSGMLPIKYYDINNNDIRKDTIDTISINDDSCFQNASKDYNNMNK